MSLLKANRGSSHLWLLAGAAGASAFALGLALRGLAPGALDVVRFVGIVSFAGLVGMATAASP